MRLTIIHPCIGRHRGDRSYMRTWQMESLPAAVIAGLTPSDVEVRFYDDRMETIPFDAPLLCSARVYSVADSRPVRASSRMSARSTLGGM